MVQRVSIKKGGIMKIYCAHAMSGLPYNEVEKYYRTVRKKFMKYGYEVLCPISCEFKFLGLKSNDEKIMSSGYENPIVSNQAILNRDHWMVLQADIIFVNLKGSKRVSIGCMQEIAWAFDHFKHVVLVMEKDNIHNHAFVKSEAHVVFEDEEQAFKYLEYLIKK